MEGIEIVRAFYDQNPELEWNRLSEQPVEFLINKRFIGRHIQGGERVLDIGGGPGRYALWLAGLGCEVTLADLSLGNVEYARKMSEHLSLPVQAVQANALDLSQFPDAGFDHVLLMGPLYHLTEQADRERAVREAMRVLRPGGTLSAAFIASFAGAIFALRDIPEAILDPKEQVFFEGIGNEQPFSGMGFTHAYNILQQDVEPFMARMGLLKLHFLSSEGILAPFSRQLREASSQAFEAWVQLAIRLCENKKYMAFAEHLLYIGRKPFPA